MASHSQQTDANHMGEEYDAEINEIENNEADSGESTLKENEAKTKMKKRKNASPCWDHFVKKPEGDRATCNYCKNDYACHPRKNGTSQLQAHMNRCPKGPFWKPDSDQKILAWVKKQKNSEEGTDSNLTTVTWTKEGFRRALAIYIVLDELPFRHVEGEGFKQYSFYMNPRFADVSRITVARDIYQLYLDEKVKLKEELNGHRVCVTTDTWTSIQNINYMCVTAHWITKGFKLKKKIISFAQIANHKGETIAQALIECFNDWGITKLFSITVDNASSNDTAIDKLKRKLKDKSKFLLLDGEWLHIRCVCHIINLVVNDGLKELSPSIAAIRNAVRYVRSSPARLQKFKDLAKKEEIESSALLCLDVPTRWNSTYLMLEAAVKYQKAFNSMTEDDLHYQSYFTDLAYGKPMEGPPTDKDWDNARVFGSFLGNFYELTLRLSGSLYLTSNRYLQDIVEAKNHLNKLSEDDEELVCGMARSMKMKYDKYWGRATKMNHIY